MHRFTIYTAAIIAILTASLACTAQADDMQDSVMDAGKHVVTSTNGNCVRTKWNSDNDPCAPPKPVAAASAPAPVAPPPPAPKPVIIAQDQRTVYFDFDKDTIRPDARTTLDQLAGLIRASGQVTRIHVVGYVDPIGGESEKNIALSQRRAEAVRNYLAALLTIPSDATVKGLGVSHSAECSKKGKRSKRIACLQPVRRVEVELTYRKE